MPMMLVIHLYYVYFVTYMCNIFVTYMCNYEEKESHFYMYVLKGTGMGVICCRWNGGGTH